MLAHDITGNGPPLVLVHGLASSRRAWDSIVDDLAADHRVIAVDLPGHGDSAYAGDDLTPAALGSALGRFLDDLGIGKAHLVGNSLGGWTVLEAAADGRALSVTALCPAGLWTPPTRLSPLLAANRRAAQLLGGVAPTLLRPKGLRRIAFRTGVERGVPHSVAVDAVRAQVAARGFASASTGVLNRRFDRAGEITADVPVTIVFGDRDRLLPPPRNQQRELAPAHARWTVLWNCGHAPMWDVPAETTALIRSTAA